MGDVFGSAAMTQSESTASNLPINVVSIRTLMSTISIKTFVLVVIGLLILASLPFRFGGLTPDTSWLLDVCEQILAGKAIYVDIIELAPPVPLLLYMPAAILGHLVSVRSDFLVYVYAYTVVLGCLFLSSKILPERLDGIGNTQLVFILPSALFLLLLSFDAFTQRELFAVTFLLPMISVVIRMMELGELADARLRIIAIAMAGLSFAIKPPLFALPGIAMIIVLVTNMRALRPAYSTGLVAAGALSGLITVISLLAFPAYFNEVLPLMKQLYVQNELPLKLLQNKAIIGTLALLMVSVGMLVMQPKLRRIPTLLMLVLTVSYLVVFCVQRKFFNYHILPAAMFAFGSFSFLIAPYICATCKRGDIDFRPIIQLGVVGLSVIVTCAFMMRGFMDHRPPVDDLEWAADLETPTAAAISIDHAIQFPLVRRIGAQWIDRVCGQWLSGYVQSMLRALPEGDTRRASLSQLQNHEIDNLITLINDDMPDILFVCELPRCIWLRDEMLRREPALLTPYVEVARFPQGSVLRRLQ